MGSQEKQIQAISCSDILMMSFHNTFGDYIDSIHVYPINLEIKDTTDIHMEIDSESQLRAKLYHIVNFPFMCSNIPTAPAYGLMRYSRHGLVVLIRSSLIVGCC
jgi:hypothetical protein